MATKTVTRTVTEIITICDRCGRETDLLSRCAGCGDMLCERCYEYRDDGGRDDGVWCDLCAEIGSPFVEKMAAHQEECDKKESVLREEWIDACAVASDERAADARREADDA